MKRLFAAIKIIPNEQFQNLYWSLRNSLKHEKIKWVEEENLHLTLKFFGETFEDQIDPVCEVLNDSTLECDSFELQLKSLGIFGSSYNPKVIWVGTNHSPGLQCLNKSIVEKLKTIGYFPDRQNFVPHLTIARIRKLNDKNLFQKIIDKNKTGLIQKADVKKLFLFESILSSKGPVYNVIEEFKLK